MTLEQLYQNRNFLVFMFGINWFNQEANKHFKKFTYQSNIDGMDADFYRILWEVEQEVV
jgi:hypothetical protein